MAAGTSAAHHRRLPGGAWEPIHARTRLYTDGCSLPGECGTRQREFAPAGRFPAAIARRDEPASGLPPTARGDRAAGRALRRSAPRRHAAGGCRHGPRVAAAVRGHAAGGFVSSYSPGRRGRRGRWSSPAPHRGGRGPTTTCWRGCATRHRIGWDLGAPAGCAGRASRPPQAGGAEGGDFVGMRQRITDGGPKARDLELVGGFEPPACALRVRCSAC